MFVSEQKVGNIIVLVLTSLFLSLSNQTKTQPYPNSHVVADNQPALRYKQSSCSVLSVLTLEPQLRLRVSYWASVIARCLHWTVSDIFNDIMR